VDLFVRTTNRVAIGMYEQFGYSVYRRVKGYYHTGTGGKKHEDEDAFGTIIWEEYLLMIDMRKPMKRDKLKQSVRKNGENIVVSPDEVAFL
jgi:N-terminal acetyltransferase B complex catalytic subunit